VVCYIGNTEATAGQFPRHQEGFAPMKFTTMLRGAFAAVAALSLAACGINSVPTAEEEAKAKWADVEAQFQRRANLIPNLAETVQGAAENERGILTEVTEARARATSINITGDDLDDPAKMEQFAAAQSQLGAGIGRLLASVEAYPTIQSNQNFLALQSQLEGTENRIAVAIRDYNEAVRQYNTTIRTFPDTIGANIIHGAEPLVPYSAVTEGAEVAPTLDMTSN
jgi:LemA protein